jgi:hypothetical protein
MDNLLLAFSDVQIRPKVGFAPAAVVANQLLWKGQAVGARFDKPHSAKAAKPAASRELDLSFTGPSCSL